MDFLFSTFLEKDKRQERITDLVLEIFGFNSIPGVFWSDLDQSVVYLERFWHPPWGRAANVSGNQPRMRRVTPTGNIRVENGRLPVGDG